MNEREDRLHRLLRARGLNRTYSGYKYLLCALRLLREDPGRLELVTKRLYPDVAKEFSVTPGGVDKALRTAVRRAAGEGVSVKDFLAGLQREEMENADIPL